MIIKQPVKKIYNLLILDESGSMMSIKQPIIEGFNKITQSIRQAAKKKALQQWVNFYSFNSSGITEQIPVALTNHLVELNSNTYNPDNTTPLYDAIGISCNRLRKYLEKETSYKVLVTILTDGEENASTEYDYAAVVALIQELKEEGWLFTYVGTDHDVEKTADRLNIKSSMAFKKDQAGVSNFIVQESRRRMEFYDKVIASEEVDESTYFGDGKK